MGPFKIPEIKYTKLFINNKFVDSVTKKVFATINPTTGDKICDVAECTKEDVDIAVKAARAASSPGSAWRSMDASARGKLMYKLADLVERDREYLAALESLDNGKTVPDSDFDIQCAIDTFRYFAGWADKIHGQTIPIDGPLMSFTRKEPIGVCAAICPFNYPILMACWKMCPALASGCSLILKPSELTPLTTLVLAELTKEAGYPDGVFNVVPGAGETGATLASHMDIDKIAFTGSTVTGKLVAAAAAQSNLKKVTLELGGKSPLIILDDADIDQAAEIAHGAIFNNHGQNCVAGSRTFVQSGIYDKFIKKSVELVQARKVGDPFAEGIQQGPQIDSKGLNKIIDLVESGKKEGAKVEVGGSRKGDKGYFFETTIFSNVTDNMRIAKEEIFGPVMSVLKFDTVDEAIERANATPYGLASGIITNDLNKALKFVQSIKSGNTWVNCYDAVAPQAPFGGYKQSGQGRELGEICLGEYLETKTVTIGLKEKI